MSDSDPAALTRYVAEQLDARQVMYLHVLEMPSGERPGGGPAADGDRA